MKKGFKHATKEVLTPNKHSSHPAERILAVRKPKEKGTLSKVKRVEQAVGVDNWQRLCEYVTNEGAVKYISTLEELGQKEYVIAFNAILEYIKPKLIRSDNRNINVNIDKEDINFI